MELRPGGSLEGLGSSVLGEHVIEELSDLRNYYVKEVMLEHVLLLVLLTWEIQI